MKKNDFIKTVASKTGFTQDATKKTVTAFIETVIESLKNDESVNITGFGTFDLSKRPDRIGRNPKTGAALKIKATKSPKFKIGKTFKDAFKNK